MTLPVLKVEIDFASGPSFSYPLILDDLTYGILDNNSLGDTPADIVDVSDMVMRVSTRRGRNRILSNFEAGTATVVLNDPNGDFNPQNAPNPPLNPGSPYYGKLLPLRKIRIYAQTPLNGGTVEVNLFSGYITSYDTSFYQGVDSTSTVTLQCVDGFRLINNVATGINPVPGCPAGQLSGARVDALLDFAGWPTSMRAISAGNSTMMADPGGNRNLLQAIQTIEQSEFGAFFMSRNGKAVFLNRELVSEIADSTARVYSDEGYTYQLPYYSLDFAYDDQLILNDVTVTRYNDGTMPAPVPQEIIDQNSIDTYFVKSGQRSDILVETDQEANDQARLLVASRKDAELRIDSMTLTITGDQSEQDVLINLTNDIYTLVNITKTMPGGSTITSEVFIQGVQFDITPNSWVSKVLTAEPIIQAFILDSQNQGVLDINNLTY
jgi:hypothetical protein